MGWIWVRGTEEDVVGEAREARVCCERVWRAEMDKRVSVVVLVEWWRTRRNGFLSRRPHTSDAGTGDCRVGSRFLRRCKSSQCLRNWSLGSCKYCEQLSSRQARKQTGRLLFCLSILGLVKTRSYSL